MSYRVDREKKTAENNTVVASAGSKTTYFVILKWSYVLCGDPSWQI